MQVGNARFLLEHRAGGRQIAVYTAGCFDCSQARAFTNLVQVSSHPVSLQDEAALGSQGDHFQGVSFVMANLVFAEGVRDLCLT